MSRRVLIVGLGLVCVAIVAMLPLLFEVVEEEEVASASGPAAFNPFYAAERMLEALGVPARSSWDVQAPPERTDVLLVLLDDSVRYRADQADALHDWVQAGGRLLVVVSGQPQTPLLDRFDVQRQPMASTEGVLTVLPLMDGRAPLPVALLPSWSVSSTHAARRWALTSASGSLENAAISSRYGKGWIGVVGGAAHWQSNRIGDAGHATWLWDMVTDSGAASVLFAIQGQAPSLAALLWQHGRTVVISLVALLLAAGWRVSWRFGPMLPATPSQRRQLIEHIDASGAFLWRSAAGRAALTRCARRAAGEDGQGPVPSHATAFTNEIRRLQPSWRQP